MLKSDIYTLEHAVTSARVPRITSKYYYSRVLRYHQQNRRSLEFLHDKCALLSLIDIRGSDVDCAKCAVISCPRQRDCFFR